MPTKEYQRQWRLEHPGYYKKYNTATKEKLGTEYFTEAVKKHRQKDIERAREKCRKSPTGPPLLQSFKI